MTRAELMQCKSGDLVYVFRKDKREEATIYNVDSLTGMTAFVMVNLAQPVGDWKQGLDNLTFDKIEKRALLKDKLDIVLGE
jgi:hypothetical protein